MYSVKILIYSNEKLFSALCRQKKNEMQYLPLATIHKMYMEVHVSLWSDSLAHEACLPCRQMTFLQGKKVRQTEVIIITWSCFVIRSPRMLLPARGIHILLSKQPWKYTQRLNSKPQFYFLLSISNQIVGRTIWANVWAVLYLPSSAGITPRFQQVLRRSSAEMLEAMACPTAAAHTAEVTVHIASVTCSHCLTCTCKLKEKNI